MTSGIFSAGSISRVQRFVARVTCFAFFLSMTVGSPSAISGAKQSSDAKQLKLMSKIYELSVRSYKKHKNPSGFLWGIEHLIDEDVSAGVAVVLAHSKEVLPTVDYLEASNSLRVNSADGRKITITPVDTANGKFLVQGKAFQWNLSEGFQSNIMRLQALLGGEHASFDVWSLLFPSAHAGDGANVQGAPPPASVDPQKEAKEKCKKADGTKKKACGWAFWIGVALAVIAVGLLIYFVTKPKKKKSQSSNSSGGGDDGDDGGEPPVDDFSP